MDLSSWHSTSRAHTEGAVTGIIPGSAPSKTGALRADQQDGMNTSPSDLRSVAQRCLQYGSSNTVQINNYSHVRMGDPNESIARWSAECSRPGTPATSRAPVAYMGDGPGEEPTVPYLTPRPSLVETNPSNLNGLLPAESSGRQLALPAPATVRRGFRSVAPQKILPRIVPAGHMTHSKAL